MNKGLKEKSIEILKNLQFYKMAKLAKARRRWLFEKDSRVSVDPGYIENNNVDKRYEKSIISIVQGSCARVKWDSDDTCSVVS